VWGVATPNGVVGGDRVVGLMKPPVTMLVAKFEREWLIGWGGGAIALGCEAGQVWLWGSKWLSGCALRAG
jgi:hypothetical protein